MSLHHEYVRPRAGISPSCAAGARSEEQGARSEERGATRTREMAPDLISGSVRADRDPI